MIRFIAVVVTLFSASVQAGTWPSVATELPPTGGGEKDAAVIIGVSDYAFLPDIPGASDNAKSDTTTPEKRPIDKSPIFT